jgi:ribosomal protein L40E
MEMVFRLALAGFVIVGPSLMFLGLWRGMLAMRDERLVERMLDETEGRVLGPRFDPAGFMPDAATPARREAGVDVETCSSCGAPNDPEATFCHECLAQIGDGGGRKRPAR